MTLHRRRFVSFAAVAGAAGLAGCMGYGGDGDATDGNETAGDGNDTDGGDAAGRRARDEYPGYDWSRLEGVAATGTDTISMQDTEFVPLVARVPVDTRITVQNDDSIPHTFTVPRAGIDEQLSAGSQTSVRFDETGTYDYVCTLHPPAMLGRLVIAEDVAVGGNETSDGSTDEDSDTSSDGGSGGYSY